MGFSDDTDFSSRSNSSCNVCDDLGLDPPDSNSEATFRGLADGSTVNESISSTAPSTYRASGRNESMIESRIPWATQSLPGASLAEASDKIRLSTRLVCLEMSSKWNCEDQQSPTAISTYANEAIAKHDEIDVDGSHSDSL